MNLFHSDSYFFKKCSTANLYLNSIIAYEIFILLRNNKQAVRHKPPSLRSVTLKAMVVYIFSIVVFAINKYLETEAMTQKLIAFEYRKSDQISLSILICNILVTYIVPIGVFFYVWISIKVRNFLPSVSGREKELVSIVPSLLKFLVCLSFSLLGYFVSHYDPFCCCCFDCLCAL